MNDKDILDYFIDEKRGKIFEARVNKVNIEKNTPEMAEYLKKRFRDGFNGYSEAIARIYNGIEEVPVCKVCGKPLKFKGLKRPYGTWCSCRCQLKDEDFIKWRSGVINYEESVKHNRKTKKERYGDENYNNTKQAQKTCLSKYGVSCPLSGEGEIRKKWEAENLEKYGKRTITNPDKIKKTKKERYGDERYVNKEQMKKTMVERYGSEYTLSSKILKEKVKSTKVEKYGNENYTNREKAKNTLKNRYGVENPYQIKAIRERIDHDVIIATKRRLGKLNSSEQERRLKEILCEVFGENDVVKEYRDDRYRNPKNNRRYCCDFYVKSRDLFIELQGHYTHGRHPYNEKSEEDKKLRKLYEAKVSEKKPSYQKILDVWCSADVQKRHIAKEKNLKYLEIFGTKFTKESVLEEINKLLKND